MSKREHRRPVNSVRSAKLESLFPSSYWSQNFTVACGTAQQRTKVFHQVLYRAVQNRIPVITLYSSNEIESLLQQVSGAELINGASPAYMPLMGMNEAEAASALNLDADNTPWQPNEWDALMDYLHLLRLMGLPLMLSALRSVLSMDYDTLLGRQAQYGQAFGSQLRKMSRYFGGDVPVRYLVRNRVSELARVMSEENLWRQDNLRDYRVSSILNTANEHGVLGIRLRANAGSKAVNYLCSELSILEQSGTPFLLACCDLIIPEQSQLAQHLQRDTGMVSFVSASHLPNAFPSQRNDFWKGMIRGSMLVLNCDIGTASAYSELYGNYLGVKTSTVHASNRRSFDMFPGMRGKSVSYSEEYLPSIEPREFCKHPRGGVYCPAGSDIPTIYCDLGL